jgi:hypothetical protein
MPGDFSVCAHCGAALVFLQTDFRCAGAEDLASLDARVLAEIRAAQHHVQVGREMGQTVRQMMTRYRAWLDSHAGVTANIQFNFPDNCLAAMTIQQALNRHFLSTNGPGLALLQSLGDLDQITPNMLRVTLDLLREHPKQRN